MFLCVPLNVEHTKKLMLVDLKLFRQSMREKTLSNLDVEIEKTLSSEISDQEKAYKYIEALRKYKYYDAPATDEKIVEKSNSESNILESISVQQRHKAKRLLDHLKRDVNFKIKDDGEIIYKQQTLNNSQIGDLLNEVLKKKSTLADAPIGWREFSDSLKELAVPKDLIENVNIWTHMHPPRAIKKKLKTKKVLTASKYATPTNIPKKRARPHAQAIKPYPVHLGKRWLEYD